MSVLDLDLIYVNEKEPNVPFCTLLKSLALVLQKGVIGTLNRLGVCENQVDDLVDSLVIILRSCKT